MILHLHEYINYYTLYIINFVQYSIITVILTAITITTQLNLIAIKI